MGKGKGTNPAPIEVMPVEYDARASRGDRRETIHADIFSS